MAGARLVARCWRLLLARTLLRGLKYRHAELGAAANFTR